MGLDKELLDVLLAYFIGGLFVFLVIFGLLYITSYRANRVRDEKLEELKEQDTLLSSRLNRVIRSTANKTIENIIENKKQKFLTMPNISFHFADKGQIRDFYNDYFKEPVLQSLVSEIAGERNAQVNAGLPWGQGIGLSFGRKGTSKRISTTKPPEVSLAGMFLQYQRETINNEQVMLGLEEVDIELTDLYDFEKLIRDLDRRFDLKTNPDLVESVRSRLKEKAAEKTLTKLEQAKDWVLIDGRFNIARYGDLYTCTYVHPVNQYLSSMNKQVIITVSVDAKQLEPAIMGNYAQSIGKLIPLKVYGKVWQPMDRKTDTWELQLTPLAIY